MTFDAIKELEAIVADEGPSMRRLMYFEAWKRRYLLELTALDSVDEYMLLSMNDRKGFEKHIDRAQGAALGDRIIDTLDLTAVEMRRVDMSGNTLGAHIPLASSDMARMIQGPVRQERRRTLLAVRFKP